MNHDQDTCTTETATAVAANAWHAQRRRAIYRKHPEVLRLLEKEPRTPYVVVAAFVVQTSVGLTLPRVVAGCSWPTAILILVILAVTVGAVSGFLFQALCHELSHARPLTRFTRFAMYLCSLPSNFPWSRYYRYEHVNHHVFTGTEGDLDGPVLYHPWQHPPAALNSPFGRWLWTLLYGLWLFPIYAYRKAMFDAPGRGLRIDEALMFGWQVLICLWSPWSLVYLHLSSAFSLGALCHPFLGWWLMQHMHVTNADDAHKVGLVHNSGVERAGVMFQPTCSYYPSSRVGAAWQWLNFSELLHVEHHDFPPIPWTRLHRLKKLAPEFYDVGNGPHTIFYCPSIRGVIAAWLRCPTAVWCEAAGDFAGRTAYLKQLERAPPQRGEWP